MLESNSSLSDQVAGPVWCQLQLRKAHRASVHTAASMCQQRRIYMGCCLCDKFTSVPGHSLAAACVSRNSSSVHTVCSTSRFSVAQ